MGLQCNNIEALRVVLKNDCEEEKPNRQIKHQFKNCVINTYDTGSVVIQDNSKDKNIEQQIKNLVQSINDLNINSCDKK